MFHNDFKLIVHTKILFDEYLSWYMDKNQGFFCLFSFDEVMLGFQCGTQPVPAATTA
jgi:hypothetical protein